MTSQRPHLLTRALTSIIHKSMTMIEHQSLNMLRCTNGGFLPLRGP
jgi:hypothetical protein